jgi:hypothetical protein
MAMAVVGVPEATVMLASICVVLWRSGILRAGIGTEGAAAGKCDGATVWPLDRDAAVAADHPAAGIAVVSRRKVLPALSTFGLLVVGSLIEVDGYPDSFVINDEVAALSSFPHTGRFQLQGDRCGFGRYGVEVVIAHEAGMAIRDAVDDPSHVQLQRRPAQRRHALELDEAAGVVAPGVRVCHQTIVPPDHGAPVAPGPLYHPVAATAGSGSVSWPPAIPEARPCIMIAGALGPATYLPG